MELIALPPVVGFMHLLNTNWTDLLPRVVVLNDLDGVLACPTHVMSGLGPFR